MLKKTLLIFVLLTNLCLNASTIQEDILKLRNTPKQDRYKIMNMIKLKLSKMNSHQRSQAIQKLFKAMKQSKSHQNSNNKIMRNNKSMQHTMKNPAADFKMQKNQNFQNHFMKKNNQNFPKHNMKSNSMWNMQGHW